MIVKVLMLAVLCTAIAASCAARFSKSPGNLGVTQGKLAVCPASPNCVSSQAEDEVHRVSPLSLSGSAPEAMAALVLVVDATPGVTVVTHTDNYLHAEYRSRMFRFVDDLEVFIDEEEQMIHFRSASRMGYSDLGVNRRRVEALKGALSST